PENRCAADTCNPSRPPREQEVSYFLKPQRPASVGIENVASLANQPGGDPLRFLDAVQGGIRGLLLIPVLAHGLPQGLARTQHVEQVVRNLKRQPDLFTVNGYALDIGFRSVRRDGARANGGADEGPRLGGMDEPERRGIRFFS